MLALHQTGIFAICSDLTNQHDMHAHIHACAFACACMRALYAIFVGFQRWICSQQQAGHQDLHATSNYQMTNQHWPRSHASSE